VVASASTAGQGEPEGISSSSSHSASRTVVAGVSWWRANTCRPSARLATSRARSRSSHIGYGLVTRGITAKLYSGGGELVAHSSVAPSQGSGPAGAPRNTLTARLATIAKRPAARR
jgi:hypothetical protein